MALHVSIKGRDEEAMIDLVRRYQVDVVSTTVGEREGGWAVDAVVPRERIAALTDAGYAVEVVEDMDKVAAARRRDIDWHPDDLPGDHRPDRPIG